MIPFDIKGTWEAMEDCYRLVPAALASESSPYSYKME